MMKHNPRRRGTYVADKEGHDGSLELTRGQVQARTALSQETTCSGMSDTAYKTCHVAHEPLAYIL